QSGNVIFRTQERDLVRLAKRLQKGLAQRFGCRPEIIFRTAAELRDVIERNPFAKRSGIDPSKLLVMFLTGDPGREAREEVLKIDTAPEELRMDGRELYIYFPNGQARPKMSWAAVNKALKTPG